MGFRGQSRPIPLIIIAALLVLSSVEGIYGGIADNGDYFVYFLIFDIFCVVTGVGLFLKINWARIMYLGFAVLASILFIVTFVMILIWTEESNTEWWEASLLLLQAAFLVWSFRYFRLPRVVKLFTEHVSNEN